MSTATEQEFNTWGILEVMGRLRLAGRITSETIAGSGFIRIDVPETKHGAIKAFTRYFTPASLYSISPTTEEVARAVAEKCHPEPANAWEVARPAAPRIANYDDDDPNVDPEYA